MSKEKEKLATIGCENCKDSFVAKIQIKGGTEGTEESEIDVKCPHCQTLLTVVIKGRLTLNQISLRHFSGKLKK